MLGCTFKPLRGGRYRVNPGGQIVKQRRVKGHRMTVANRNRPSPPPIKMVTKAPLSPAQAGRHRAFKVDLDRSGQAYINCRDCWKEHLVYRSDSFRCTCGVIIDVTATPYRPPAGYDLSGLGLKELAVSISVFAVSFKCPACGQGNSFHEDEGVVDCIGCRSPIKVTRKEESVHAARRATSFF